MELLLLCWEFFKTGLFAVGGGMATIPFLTQMSLKYPHWFSLETLADMIAVGESTPGPIGVNMATYVGYTVAGVGGGILATLSLVLPSFIVMLLVFRMLERFRNNRFVDAGFRALRPAVAGLIAAAGYAVLKIALFVEGALDLRAAILFAVLFTLTQVKRLKNVHPLCYIAVAAVAGILAA